MGKRIVKRLTGLSGFLKGSVIGTVCVVDYEDPTTWDKLQFGDVLVGTNFGMDGLYFMQKAAAIILDQGGRTSRILRLVNEIFPEIPIIVGGYNQDTKEPATMVLKDGMLVEVESPAGIVWEYEETPIEKKRRLSRLASKRELTPRDWFNEKYGFSESSG
jgi:phosphohistidine swiveling domain-containing protein